MKKISSREKLLITGGSGTLGINLANMAYKDLEVIATYNLHPRRSSRFLFIPLDIRNKQQVLSVIENIRPGLVIHAAAIVDVDYCEDHAEEAWLTNVLGTENVAQASKRCGSKMIYISTDGVFDGSKGMYSEKAIPNPINVYTRTKLEGEVRVQNCLPDGIIIRASFYGWSRGSKRGNIGDWVVNALRRGETLNMYKDVFFSPIYAANLAQVMIEMYRKGLSGIYHVGSRERCSKYTFGNEIAKLFKLNGSLIHPSSIDEAELRAPRPKDVSMNVAKVSSMVSTHLLDVKEGIAWFRDDERIA